jgi:GlcNAc-P-P-Und epimerase
MINEKEIAIVGGSGFVGSFLSKILDKNKTSYHIYDLNLNIENDNVTFADVTSLDTLESIKNTSVIINLAAEHRDDVSPTSKYDDVNVEGARNICTVARKNNINKIIFTSSVAIYGFAPNNTDESGKPNYFNDYGRTKFLAEAIYKEWQEEDPLNRTLTIIRPTVIFGPGNRGNIYNLLKQIASKKFIMIGNGNNIKSIAYVENVAAFISHSMSFKPGINIYNYIDKPDFTMNQLVSNTRKVLFNKNNVGLRIPLFLGVMAGYFFDALALILNKKLSISSIRIKKFSNSSQFNTSISKSGFVPKIHADKAWENTIKYEFLSNNSNSRTFDTE